MARRRVPPLTGTEKVMRFNGYGHREKDADAITVLGVRAQTVTNQLEAECLTCHCLFKGTRLFWIRRLLRDHFLSFEAIEATPHDKFKLVSQYNCLRRYQYRVEVDLPTERGIDPYWHKYLGKG